jgi:hypothetical protein
MIMKVMEEVIMPRSKVLRVCLEYLRNTVHKCTPVLRVEKYFGFVTLPRY